MQRKCGWCMYEDCGSCLVNRKPKALPKTRTCKRFRPKYEGYSAKNIHKRMLKDLNALLSKANGWDKVMKFIKEDIRVKPYLNQIQDDMRAANNQSGVVMILSTLDLILEKITEYEEEYGDV